MKKVIFGLSAAFIIVATLFSSCSKERQENADKNSVKSITEYLKTTDAKILVNEVQLWQSFSGKIDWRKEPEQSTYQNTSLKSITFHLKNSDKNVSFNSLVVFYKDRKILPIIIKGENADSNNIRISYFTPENIPYLNFSIDKKHRIFNYDSMRNIPFKETFEEPFTGQTVFSAPAEKTCLNSTDSFKECVQCVVEKEIADSEVATIGCMVFGAYCAATIVVMCGGAQL
jgi:hypothetical protein